MQTKINHAKRVQAAFFAFHNPDRTVKQLARKFSMSEKELEKAVKDYKKTKLLRKSKFLWNPEWDDKDVIFHADDVYLHNDIVQGKDKQSVLQHGLFDPEYDAVNGGYHYSWSENDVETLLCSLPYRVLEILRDSEPGSEDYEEAVLFMDSDLFKAICKKNGLDAEEVQYQALSITKAHF